LTAVLITLTTSSNNDLLRGEREINDYIDKQSLTDKSLSLRFDLRQWDQRMLNAFYSYCLTKSVLPQINLMSDLQLQLIGSISDVHKAMTKCKLMCEISKEIVSTTTSSSVSEKNSQKHTSSTGYNIYFSYCRSDQSICNQLTTCLTNEGYSLCRRTSKKSLSTSDIEKSDVFLVGFSDEYSKKSYCMSELNHAKSIGKKLVPFVIRQDTQENQWLSSLTMATLFYDLFDREIDLEFIDDFDLEYDQLLSTLVSRLIEGFSLV
jgi:hypothetical protein